MSALSRLTVREVRVRALSVPMPRPLYTSGGTILTAPLVLIDLLTEEGVTGRAYLFCYTPAVLVPVARLLANMEDWLKGEAVAPLALEARLQKRFRLLGTQGLTGMAMAGLDMAAWDALARAAELPLVRLLGGEPRPLQTYNSTGLGIIGPERAAAEAVELLEPGYRAIKVRLGYPDPKTDLEVVRAIRGAVGDDVVLMSDFNQSLSVPEALNRVRLLDGEGLYWFEEPTSADDYTGHAKISLEARTPVQMGENWWGSHEMAKSLAAAASDYVMVDAMKIGGVSGWLRAAALAEPSGWPLSSHIFPEISSHLLAVSPTCHWLEYLDVASPILQQPLVVEKGFTTPSDTPGTGLDWNEEVVARFLVE